MEGGKEGREGGEGSGCIRGGSDYRNEAAATPPYTHIPLTFRYCTYTWMQVKEEAEGEMRERGIIREI